MVHSQCSLGICSRVSAHTLAAELPCFACESRLLRWTGRFKGFQPQLCFDTASSVFHTVKRGRVAGLSTLFCFALFFSQLSALMQPCEFSFLLRAVFIESLVCVLGRASLFPRQIGINMAQHLDAGVSWSRLNLFVVV